MGTATGWHFILVLLLLVGAVLKSQPTPGIASPVVAEKLPLASIQKIDFRRDIYPLLKQSCFTCHSGPTPKSGYRLDVRAVILGKSTGKPLAVAGHSADSRLIHLISGLLEEEVMPPPRSGKRLSPEQVGLLRAWIDQGVSWDEQLLPSPPEEKHWAFQPIQRPLLPVPRNASWSRTPVDAFVAAEHEKRGLTPAPEASRERLLRRLSLDLTGLPPTATEIESFLSDTAADACDRLVERLLDSPHYGERWGRHWLDVARYAESEGYENNHLRPYAWRYRDYVVRSFNEDKPFDWFIRQQVAGDELLPYSDENLIATGFLAAARYSSNEEDKALQRNDVLVDMTNATTSAILGLTFSCAQCHDHKFDPITQQDYYRFQGFFVKGQMNNLLLKDPTLWQNYEAAKPAAFEPAVQLRDLLLDQARTRLMQQAGKKRSHEAKTRFKTEEIEMALSGDDKQLYDALKRKIAALEKQLPDKPQTIGFYSPATSPTAVNTLPLKANYPLPYSPEELKKTKPCLLIRGDVHQRGPELEVGWPKVLGPMSTDQVERRPRMVLADWLTEPSQPLTARVWVNRIWQHHFGRGLCSTPGDLGTRGAKPTHPALLDYLAAELMGNRWSTKHVHRLIVRSATYRQAAQENTANARIDPDNQYLWHWTPRRLEAEIIRDIVLAVSGELDRTMGGPGLPLSERTPWRNEVPHENEKVLRRSLYLEQRRNESPPVQDLFDGPTANESCASRHVSTVPLQPLFLLNSAFMRNRARAFATEVDKQAGKEPQRQVDLAFRLALGRLPDESERRIALTLFTSPGEGLTTSEQSALVRFCHLLFNLNEFVYQE